MIVGPTAGGKTAFAIELARRLPGAGECISADSMQVYRGLDIGTAKPTPREQALVPHHLIDMVDPRDESFSVDRWLDLAEQVIEEIRARKRLPIVVGGTNLYVKALLEGLFEAPGRRPELRERLETQSLEALRAELERIDPAAAARIHRNDRRRAIRAIEVFHETGIPISAQQRQWDQGRLRPDALIIGLDYPAAVITRRINARVKAMFDAGLVEEVRALHEADMLGRQASEALGYKQLLAHFRGELTLDEVIEEIKIQTRRYAKQQRTWLRRFRHYPNSLWLPIEDHDAQLPVEKAVTWIEGTLMSRPHSS